MEYAQYIGDSGQNLLSAVDDIFEMTEEHVDVSHASPGDFSSAPIASQPNDDPELRELEAVK